jgi:hypothetical protein
MEKWEEGFYVTAVAGSDNNNSLVVMSKGARFNQQSYKVKELVKKLVQELLVPDC